MPHKCDRAEPKCPSKNQGSWAPETNGHEFFEREPHPLAQDPHAVAAGEKLFGERRSECHGEHGEGTRRGPSLVAEPVRSAIPGALAWILKNGVVRHGMADWSKRPERERWQIVAFLKSRHE
jgi:mono/diheme cytochrome c family protein